MWPSGGVDAETPVFVVSRVRLSTIQCIGCSKKAFCRRRQGYLWIIELILSFKKYAVIKQLLCRVVFYLERHMWKDYTYHYLLHYLLGTSLCLLFGGLDWHSKGIVQGLGGLDAFHPHLLAVLWRCFFQWNSSRSDSSSWSFDCQTVVITQVYVSTWSS